MSDEPLLPCPVPWCGSDDARRYEGDATYAPRVQCPKCRLTASAGTLSAAIAKWNARPPQSPDLRAAAKEVVRLAKNEGVAAGDTGKFLWGDAVRNLEAALSAPQSSVRADNRKRIAGDPWDAGQIKNGKAQQP